MDVETILVLDYGSQYTQLIARRIRQEHVYSEIHPYSLPISEIKKINPAGIILSGGPGNIYAQDSPGIDNQVFELGIPILGICYGMQLISHKLGGRTEGSQKREYGNATIKVLDKSNLFGGIKDNETVWMSHGDRVVVLPEGFFSIAETETAIAGIANPKKHIYGLQFHPEVQHTVNGMTMLRNFLFNICKVKANWQMATFIQDEIKRIKQEVGSKKVALALSGGVDSSVLSVLLHEALGDQLTCFFVDNGLLRKNEGDKVMQTFANHFSIKVKRLNSETVFLDNLKNISNPEDKRKIIGKTFIDVFMDAFEHYEGGFDFLAQGTLYPDVIESVSTKGPSDTIKTHHNRVKEVLELETQGRLIEPFKELFKDEVREIGKELGLPDEIIFRHPFPGPGLAVRCLGEITKNRLDILREADAIFIEELKKNQYYYKVSQAFAVLLPVNSVGVMGDVRTYENVIALRSVDTLDFMTADWSKLPYELMGRIATRIINEVKGVNRVVMDISSKPPATIEWE